MIDEEKVKPQPMHSLTIGRMVHYVLGNNGKHRPAVVVEVHDAGLAGVVNLQVFTDGLNDFGENTQGILWRTSVMYSEEKTSNTWHWPEYVP